MADGRLSWEQAVETLRQDPQSAELVRHCFYDDPVAAAAARFSDTSEWRETSRILPKPGRALDLGAGRGIASYALARNGWQVTALEPDPSNIVGAGAIRVLAANCGLAIDVVEDWGEELPFRDGSFDLVYCRAVLHHARNLGSLCNEVARVLRPGGRFLAVREHVISRQEDLQAFLEGHPLHKLYGGENAYLLKEYLGRIRDAGLVIERVLGPHSSEINIFPESIAGLKRRIASRLHLPQSSWIPDAALRMLDWFSNAPGRHYSFLAVKAMRGSP